MLLFDATHNVVLFVISDVNAAEAISQIENELTAEEKKDTEETSIADNLYFNIAFLVIVVGFWLKYFEVL